MRLSHVMSSLSMAAAVAGSLLGPCGHRLQQHIRDPTPRWAESLETAAAATREQSFAFAYQRQLYLCHCDTSRFSKYPTDQLKEEDNDHVSFPLLAHCPGATGVEECFATTELCAARMAIGVEGICHHSRVGEGGR